MTWKDKVIYCDPGNQSPLALFTGLPRPTLVFITNIHGPSGFAKIE
jgi:hypothetical protein